MIGIHGVKHFAFEVEQFGFSIIPDLLNDGEIETLCSAISNVDGTSGVRTKNTTYAIRNLLDAIPAVAKLARSEKVMALVRAALGSSAFPVRGMLFNKTPDANWLVPWHQDLTICVRERIDTPGYGPWTSKAGVPHVQPPVSVLDAMLAVRIHLDDCQRENGALRTLPGTHLSGRLSPDQIALAQQEIAPVTCSVNRGGVLLMKPLLLHASSAALEPANRRVIHIEFAACELAPRLEWFSERQLGGRNRPVPHAPPQS